MNKIAQQGLQIPLNKIGKAVDLEHTVISPNEEEAIKTFMRASKRLLNPPVWKEISGMFSASFHLTDSGKANPHRLAMVGDYLSINFPGPGNSAGEGYDWVQVANIIEHSDPAIGEFAIELHASINPGKPYEGIAHFFMEGATSIFVVRRKGYAVTAFYHGRNEVPNTNNVSLGDKLRNTIVAAGARAGISELQWTALIKGLLEKEL